MKRLTPTRVFLGLALAALILAVCTLTGLFFGSSAIPPASVLEALAAPDPADPLSDIVWRIRLPRLMLAMLVGASLSVAGVIFQALLRNPLADPFILGVSGGAALGGIGVLTLGGALGLTATAAPYAAFAGAIVATLLLYAFAAGRGRVAPTQLLLTGVVFNAFASAGIVFLASLAGLVDGARIFIWLIGNLSAANASLAWVVALFLATGMAFAIGLARSMNLLALGDESAEQLGVSIQWHKRVLLLATSLMVGAAVSVSGLIGFVGLIIPHLLRGIVGPDHRLLVPVSALSGAAFLVVCDTLARSLLDGRELPVGAITALVGGPFFLVLLRRQHRRAWFA